MLLPKNYDSYRGNTEKYIPENEFVIDHCESLKGYLENLFSSKTTAVPPAYLLDYASNAYTNINSALAEMLNVSKNKILDQGPDGCQYFWKADDYTVYNNEIFIDKLITLNKAVPSTLIHHKQICNYRVHHNNKFMMVRQESFILRNAQNGLPLVVLGYLSNIDKMNHHNQMFHQIVDPAGNLIADEIYTPDEKDSLFCKREKEIIRLSVLGITPLEMAGKLNISIHTVYTYRKRIYQKAGTVNWHDIEEML